MPWKMSGSEISTIDWLIIAISTPSVVLDRTIHLYPGREVPRGLGRRGRARFRWGG